MGAVLSGVALLGTWGSTQWAPSWADKLTDSAGNGGRDWARAGIHADRAGRRRHRGHDRRGARWVAGWDAA